MVGFKVAVGETVLDRVAEDVSRCVAEQPAKRMVISNKVVKEV